MSLGRIIISIAICIGILLFQKTEPKFLKAILIGFILSFLSSFFDGELFSNFSFLSIGILVLLYFVYSVYYKKWLPAVISAFPLLSFIFKVQHWPHASEIKTAMVIPVILFIITLFNDKKYKNQFGILTILVAYSIAEIIRLIEYMVAINS